MSNDIFVGIIENQVEQEIPQNVLICTKIAVDVIMAIVVDDFETAVEVVSV